MKSKTADLIHMLNCWVWHLCESGVPPRHIAQAFGVTVLDIEEMSMNYVRDGLRSKFDNYELECIAQSLTSVVRPIVQQRIAILQSIADAEVQT